MALKGLLTVDETNILEVDADPSTSGGVAAPLSSIAMLDNNGVSAGLWLKTGAADTAWTAITGGSGGSGWGLTGNAGTNPTTNYIGTSDSQSLSLRTNATEVIRLTSAGEVIIGATGSSVYRLTNAGSDFSAQLVVDAVPLGTGDSFAFDENNGFIFARANGTRRIARSAWQLVDVVDTPGAETGGFAILAKPAGGPLTESWRTMSNGFVGVNTQTPQTRFDVQETLTTDPRGLSVTQYSAGGFGAMACWRAARGTPAAPTQLLAGDEIAIFGGISRTASGWGTYWQSGIRFRAEEPQTTTAQGQSVALYTTPLGHAGQEEGINRLRRLLADADGNIILGHDTINNTIDILQIPLASTTNIPAKENFEDFNFNTLSSTANAFAIINTSSGSGAAASIQGVATGNDYCGLAICSTGTTSTGRSAIDFFNGNSRVRFGASRIFYEWRVRIPTLSTSSQTFQTIVGLTDLVTSGLPTNGVYFYYSHGTNSGQWRCTCRASSSSTDRDSAITVVANQWYKLRAEINAAGTTVTFFIDNVQVGTSVSTQIPSSTTGLRYNAKIEKTNGTSALAAHFDYLYWKTFR